MDFRLLGRIFLSIFVGIFVAIIIKIFLIDIIHIQGESMEPTIHQFQAVVVNKLSYGLNRPFGDSLFLQWSQPKTDDVVIFMLDDKLIVKRCAATENAPLEYSYNSGYTLRTGDKNIPLTDEQYHRMKDIHCVPSGTILVIGDNYQVSIDSRTYGFVPVKNILGKVICKPTAF